MTRSPSRSRLGPMARLGLAALGALFVPGPPAFGADLPASLDLETLRALPVQRDGRWPPLDTAARDVVETVTGTPSYRGQDPVLILLAWTFDPAGWMQEPLIEISSAELRSELGLAAVQAVFSYEELRRHVPLQEQIRQLANIPRGRKPDPLESKVSDIRNRLLTLEAVFLGQVIRPIPHPDAIVGSWRPIRLPAEEATEPLEPVAAAWFSLRRAFLADDATAFAEASEQLVSSLSALPAPHRPDPAHIAIELRYNRVQPFRTAWIVMVVGAVLAALAMLIRRRWCDALAVLGLFAGFGLLTYGLWLRWQIAGSLPATNMFESLLFLSWGMGAFAILAVFVVPGRVVTLLASALGALALVLADLLPLDSYIRPISAVLLDTIWMSIHVPIIMVSYSVLAMAVVVAHVQLMVMAAAPGRRPLAETIENVHYWFVHIGSILLIAGIITGSMWAASSWGRYWGWDPKEVWSLVAFLGYLAILHARIDHDRMPVWAWILVTLLGAALIGVVGWLLAPMTGAKVLALAGTAVAMAIFIVARGQFASALKSVLAFWLIIMTYVGVNFVLGTGLHSYGFGTGAVVKYLFRVGGIDLALVAICSVIYLIRRAGRPRDGGVPPVMPAAARG